MEKNERGIFSIEGEDDDGRSVRPTLELLASDWDFPRLYRAANKRAELVRSLKEWAGRTDWKYPIVYVSSHGLPKGVHIDDPKGAGYTRVDLDTVSDILVESAVGDQGMSGTVLHFGTCSTLAAGHDQLRQFFKTTALTAVSGYRRPVRWVDSVAFELLYLDCLQKLMSDCNDYDSNGERRGLAPELAERVRTEVMDSRKCRGLVDALGFRMFVSDDFEDD